MSVGSLTRAWRISCDEMIPLNLLRSNLFFINEGTSQFRHIRHSQKFDLNHKSFRLRLTLCLNMDGASFAVSIPSICTP
jgi:hypothetical protein